MPPKETPSERQYREAHDELLHAEALYMPLVMVADDLSVDDIDEVVEHTKEEFLEDFYACMKDVDESLGGGCPCHGYEVDTCPRNVQAIKKDVDINLAGIFEGIHRVEDLDEVEAEREKAKARLKAWVRKYGRG